MTTDSVILSRGNPKALLPLCQALQKSGVQPTLIPVKGG